MKSETLNKFFPISAVTIVIIIFTCFRLNPVPLLAAPYVGDVFSLSQPDGSRIEVKVWGDEFYHRIESLDGYTLTKDEDTGWICYAQLAAEGSELVSTGISYKGKKNRLPTALKGFMKHIKLPGDVILAKVEKKRQELYAGIDPYVLPGMPNNYPQAESLSGSVLGLTLLIDFPDASSSISQTEIQNYLNQNGYSGYGCNGSVRDYFSDVSDGLLDYTNHVTEFYTAIHNKSYYTDPCIPYGQRARELILEALDHLEIVVGFDFSTLSTNSSNQIFAINAFYAGEVNNAWAEGLWPHMSTLWPVFSADDVQSGAYQITAIGNNLTLRTFCHENGHMLFGWPDLYDYGYESNGVGHYCLMCYGGNNDNPVPPCADLRYKAGWETIIDITGLSCTTLDIISNSFTSYRYSHPTDSKEYYLIESRVKNGRNTYLPDEGLLIWHIEEYGSNNNEQMICSQHYKVSLEQADGLFQLERRINYGGLGDLFHGEYKYEFGGNTIPNSDWWCSGISGFEIGGISAVGGIMSFTISNEALDADGDGYTTCGGDCNDTDPAVYPGAAELCDGMDNNCDTQIPADEADADGDGYMVCQGDCDDTDPAVYPGAAEFCDGIDNNCDGQLIDEGYDADGDGYTTCGGDCDDSNPAVNPGATEICDGIDNDCDSVVDEVCIVHDVAIDKLLVPNNMRECAKPKVITIVVKNIGTQVEEGTLTLKKDGVEVEKWNSVVLNPDAKDTLLYTYDPQGDGGKTIHWNVNIRISDDYDLTNNDMGPGYTIVTFCK